MNYEGSKVKRSRRGGRRPQTTHNGHNGGGGGGGGHNPNRTFDSSGPEIKVRGSASHVYEKYLQMARDANTMGDRVMAENYLQHAEHYYRILSAAQVQQQQFAQNNPQAQHQPNPNANGNGQPYHQPNGAGEQPFIQGAQPPGPSFSLVDGAAGLVGGDEDGDEDGPE